MTTDVEAARSGHECWSSSTQEPGVVGNPCLSSLKHNCVQHVDGNCADYTTEEHSAGAEMSEALNELQCGSHSGRQRCLAPLAMQGASVKTARSQNFPFPYFHTIGSSVATVRGGTSVQIALFFFLPVPHSPNAAPQTAHFRT